jgi:hypothetical protein
MFLFKQHTIDNQLSNLREYGTALQETTQIKKDLSKKPKKQLSDEEYNQRKSFRQLPPNAVEKATGSANANSKLNKNHTQNKNQDANTRMSTQSRQQKDFSKKKLC